MKLELEIPEWAQDRHIRVFAGIELLAYKPYGQDKLFVKTERCIMCGWCCENLRPGCPHLVPDGSKKICELGTDRPFACSWSDPNLTNARGKENCAIRYEEL